MELKVNLERVGVQWTCNNNNKNNNEINNSVNYGLLIQILPRQVL